MHALMISSDVPLVAELKNRLELLCESCQQTGDYSNAKSLLQAGEFDLSIIDDEIPCKPGCKPISTWTSSLIKWISQLTRRIAVLIMSTLRETWQADFIISMQEEFGVSAVRKPLDHQRPDHATFESIIARIRETHQQNSAQKLVLPKKKPIVIPTDPNQVTLEFGADNVYLCGEKLCSIDSCTAQALALLAERYDAGSYKPMSSEELARRLGIASNSIRVAIYRKRNKFEKFKQLIINDKSTGYRLCPDVEIQ